MRPEGPSKFRFRLAAQRVRDRHERRSAIAQQRSGTHVSAADDALKNAGALPDCPAHEAPAANSPNAFDAETAAAALVEHKEHTK
jgi:hypothetical protein